MILPALVLCPAFKPGSHFTLTPLHTSNVLASAGPRSLVLVDELGKGTEVCWAAASRRWSGLLERPSCNHLVHP